MRILLALWALVIFLLPASAQTGLLNHPQAKFFSHEGNIAFLAAGLAQRDSRERARALVTSTVIVTGLKYLR
jgi:hypothetical protein